MLITNPSNTIPLVSVKCMDSQLPSCPCVGSYCVVGISIKYYLGLTFGQKDQSSRQVIGVHPNLLWTVKRINNDSEVCMYALTVKTIEPKNIKEAMADHSWIESMQDELNQFERLQVWELVPRPAEKNVIALKWAWEEYM
ncbi:retrovirus-related pol polyprotein from transposon TNT 1-94 [Tanacetum coccineum]|uniref:Retrovirus-related pol polyprotein from transposon TNT 1-94 n=1 Tax=Tanacetum coccineum TaxID=301880 RepID=A0ABQ5G4T0_9ASTR